MKLSTSVLRARVARGVTYLDNNCSDWPSKIDLRTLRLESGSQCVIGQCFGDFWTKLNDILNISCDDDDSNAAERKRAAWAHPRGFSLPDSDQSNGNWERLSLVWGEVIYKRQIIKASHTHD